MPNNDKEFTIVSPVKGRDACSFYRVRQLMDGLNKIDGVKSILLDMKMPEEQMNDILSEADIVLLRPGLHEFQKFVKETYDAKIVFDHDDNIFVYPPLAPEYAKFGVEEYFDKDSALWVWKDKEGGFDIERNKQALMDVIWQAKNADLFTTTTEKMLETFECESTAVIPNAINFDTYPDLDITRTDGTVRIGWQGGATHFRDLVDIMPIVKRVMKKYPHVRFINEGQYFEGLFKDWDMSKVELYPWIDSTGFSWRASCLNLDINLAPLAPEVFNLYKSAIKYYHAGALKVPTITPNIIPHSPEIKDGYSGVLYDSLEEFETKLEDLIVDRTKRKTIGENAYNWVKENRSLDRIARQALFTYKAICGR